MLKLYPKPCNWRCALSCRILRSPSRPEGSIVQRLRSSWSDTLMNPGVLAACRLMPELADRINTLASRDEAFLELCDDLAAAQRALEGLTLLPDILRRHRLAECEEWIVGLCWEIQRAVNSAENSHGRRF
jgi:hypothetical protein